jgi:hypothetical protein
MQKKQIFICDYCGEKGHKVTSCFKLNPEHRIQYQMKKEASFMHDTTSSFGSSDMTHSNTDHNDSFTFKGGVAPDDQNNTSRTSDANDSSKENIAGQFSNNQGNSYPGQHMVRAQHHQNFHHHQPHYHQPQPHFFQQNQHNFNERPYQPVPLSEVTCFKCGEKGHYANRCNKGVYSFLRGNDQDQNR